MQIATTSSSATFYAKDAIVIDSGSDSNAVISVELEERGCSDPNCAEREAIINKIWNEYCLLKDMAKWFTQNPCEITITPGADPILALLAIYMDMACGGENPYKKKAEADDGLVQ